MSLLEFLETSISAKRPRKYPAIFSGSTNKFVRKYKEYLRPIEWKRRIYFRKCALPFAVFSGVHHQPSNPGARRIPV